MGGVIDHGATGGWRYGKAVSIGDALGEVLKSFNQDERGQQASSLPLDEKKNDSSASHKSNGGYVKIPRDLLDTQKSKHKIRRIAVAIEIQLRENVRWGPYVEHFRGPFGKRNKTMTNKGELFVNISSIIESVGKQGIEVTPKQVRRRVDQLCECGVLTQPRRVPANGGVIYKANFPDGHAALDSAKYSGKTSKRAKYGYAKGRSGGKNKVTEILGDNAEKRAKYV